MTTSTTTASTLALLRQRLLYCEGMRLQFQGPFQEATREVPEWAELVEAALNITTTPIGMALIWPAILGGPLRLVASAHITAARREQARRLLPLVRRLAPAYRQLGRIVEETNALVRRLGPDAPEVREIAEVLARADVEGQRSGALLEAWERSGIGSNDPSQVPRWRAYLFPELRQARAVAQAAETHHIPERIRDAVQGEEYQPRQRPEQDNERDDRGDDQGGAIVVLGVLGLLGVIAAKLLGKGR